MTPNNTFHGHTKIILDRALPAYTVILFPTLLLLTSVGCGEAGPELGGVSGQVTLDGEPLANASMAFSGVNNGPSAYATTDDLGFYELQFNHKNKGTVLDKQKVSITTRRTGRVKPEPGQEDEPMTTA